MPDVVRVTSTIGTGRERQARVMLSFLAEPGDPALGALLRACTPAEIVAALSSGREPRAALPGGGRGTGGLARAFARWRARLGQLYGDRHQFSVVTAPGGVSARLVIPFEAPAP